MKTLASYIRWSSEIQGQGDSLERQKGMIQEFIAKHPDYIVDPEHQYFDPGKSSFKQVIDPNDMDGEIMRSMNRATGDLSRLFKNIDQKRIPRNTVLVAEAVDRFGRAKPSQSLEDFLKIINYGIEIVTLNDGMIYNLESVNNNMTSLLMYFMKAWVGYEESFKKSSRQKSINKAKREKAIKSKKPLGAVTPGWIILDKDTDKFSVDEAKANIVRHIYNLRLEGNSFYRIAILLNEAATPTINERKVRLDRLEKEAAKRLKAKGIKEPTKEEIETEVFAAPKKTLVKRGIKEPTKEQLLSEAKKNVGDWSRETVKYLLQSQTVIGTLGETAERAAIEKYYPAIIDEYTFNNVQRISTAKGCGKRTNTDSPLYVNIFQKMIICGDCGLTMTPSGMRPPVYFGSYRCNSYTEKRQRSEAMEQKKINSRAKRRKGAPANNLCRTAPRKVFDLAMCNRLFANLAQFSSEKIDREQMAKWEAELATLRKEIRKLRLMILEEEDEGEIDPELKNMLNERRKREKELVGLIKKEGVRMNALDADTLAGLDLISSSADRTKAQLAIQKIVKQVVIHGSRHTCDVHFYNGSVVTEFDYLATDDLNSALQRATDYERLQELSQLTGVNGGLVIPGKIGESTAAPDFTDWPDVEPDYPNEEGQQ